MLDTSLKLAIPSLTLRRVWVIAHSGIPCGVEVIRVDAV